MDNLFQKLPVTSPYHIRANKVTDILNQPIIDLKSIRSIVKQGIPDELPKIRESCWKLLLNYLPEERCNWKGKIDSNNKLYQQFITSFLPEERFADYPLLIDKNCQRWKQLQSDFLLWEQIEKDTSRTHSQLGFFSSAAKPIMIPFFTAPRKQKFKLVYGEQKERYQQYLKNKEQQRQTYKYDIMSRILFIYSKLNPQIKYVQGMNEVLAPIFYIVNSHRKEEIQEASCFFMLNAVMTIIIEMHIKDLDKSESGIFGKLQKVNEMLLVIEPQVWTHLDHLKIDTFYYSFRWLALLFAQDFQLFDTLRLWDSILSEVDRILYMNFVVIAILKIKRQSILKKDFIGILQELQHLKQENILIIIATANKLYEQYHKIDFEQESRKVKEKMRKKEEKSKKPSMMDSIFNKLKM